MIPLIGWIALGIGGEGADRRRRDIIAARSPSPRGRGSPQAPHVLVCGPGYPDTFNLPRAWDFPLVAVDLEHHRPSREFRAGGRART
jgi:hypothetical protein